MTLNISTSIFPVSTAARAASVCKAQGEIPETVREHYGALPHKAGECVQCGRVRA